MSSRFSAPRPDLSELLSVDTRLTTGSDEVLVTVAGEIDTFTAPLLAACLVAQANRRGLRQLVVNLDEVTFLGCAGLSILVRARQLCRALQVRLVVHGGRQRAVRRPLELAGLSSLLHASGAGPDPAEEMGRPPWLGSAETGGLEPVMAGGATGSVNAHTCHVNGEENLAHHRAA